MLSTCAARIGLLTSGQHGGVPPSAHMLGLAALGSWLLAESLGAYMLRGWLARGRYQQDDSQAERMPTPFLLGHAGMAFSGLVCWVIFLLTTAPLPAWLAVGLLVPAIGFGVSTVTVWTPYPGQRASPSGVVAAGASAGGAPAGAWPPEPEAAAGVIADAHLHRALDDEALTSRLVDDLLARNLAQDPPPARSSGLDPRPLIPLIHGLLAILTFLLTTLAAVTVTVN
jgi:hypothetical protein